MIWIIGLALFSIPVVWGIFHWGGAFKKSNKNTRREYSRSVGDGESAAVIISSIALALFVLITGGITLSNNVTVARYQAFYEANVANYEITVDRTASYLSEQTFVENALLPIEGSIEKFKLTEDLNARILEWRDAVNDYNYGISSLKYYDNTSMFGVMVPDSVQDLKLLIIKEN